MAAWHGGRSRACLQENHCQDVTCRASHTDDVGSQGVGGQLGYGAEGVDHICLLSTGLQGWRHQGPLASQLPKQELHASLLIPLPAYIPPLLHTNASMQLMTLSQLFCGKQFAVDILVLVMKA